MLCGCVQPYQPGQPNLPNKPVENVVTPSQAFDNYKLATAKNFRELANQCDKFDYVSELVDASVKLDTEARIQRAKPIDAMFRDTLGNDKLDKIKAVELLNRIADDLDPPPLVKKT
jgi:hypothetical protein